jgi:hypothetical protein
MWVPRRFATLWASTACYTDSCTFNFTSPYVKINLFTNKPHNSFYYITEEGFRLDTAVLDKNTCILASPISAGQPKMKFCLLLQVVQSQRRLGYRLYGRGNGSSIPAGGKTGCGAYPQCAVVSGVENQE